MTKATAADFLCEIGTEELPPKALKSLMLAFADGLVATLAEARLVHGDIEPFASPRRLAVRVRGLAMHQPDRDVEQKGPPVRIAFDKDGKPTRAAQAFADKCGVAVDALERESGDKGEWLVHRAREQGVAARDVVPGCVEKALASLPIPRRMRWGATGEEFVRPVHWVVMLHGKQVVPGRVLGIESGRVTQGHRFMGEGALELADAADYESRLETDGRVIADFGKRRARIVEGVQAAAAAAGGEAIANDELYDEVTALVEWPVAVTGGFDARFLELPREVIIATLTSHQRYFPVAGNDGALLPLFITVSNIESRDPDKVRDGNERVIRPRLADAAFFWDTDRQRPLADRQDGLVDVVYQQGLGTLADRSRRLAFLAGGIAGDMGEDPLLAERAALLSKCDLLTGMVGEFPELQGLMGRYYAEADKEPAAVAAAIGEQYLPRFSGDALPQSGIGRALAIAEKLDTICGAFALGKRPSGNRDPFGLRRAAFGIVRIALETGVELELRELIYSALSQQQASAPPEARDDVYDFLVERMRSWYADGTEGRPEITAEMFAAVRALRPDSLTDFDARIRAVAAFVALPEAASLAAADKRIANILRKADGEAGSRVDAKLLEGGAEKALFDALTDARRDTATLLEKKDYAGVLARLAGLRDTVDRFFDAVMVMAEDAALRRNRLALLSSLHAEFLAVADISRLVIGKG